MIVCAGASCFPLDQRMRSFRQQARNVALGLPSTNANLNAAPETKPNSSIAYLTSTMHDG
jgi:hypothetical protein